MSLYCSLAFRNCALIVLALQVWLLRCSPLSCESPEGAGGRSWSQRD